MTRGTCNAQRNRFLNIESRTFVARFSRVFRGHPVDVHLWRERATTSARRGARARRVAKSSSEARRRAASK